MNDQMWCIVYLTLLCTVYIYILQKALLEVPHAKMFMS